MDSRNTPTESIAPNPVLLDAVIERFRSRLLSLTYNDAEDKLWFAKGRVLGRALKDEKTGRPIIFLGDQEYFDAQPNDDSDSYSFFYHTDPRTQISSTSQAYNMNLVVWFNKEMVFRIGETNNQKKAYSIKEFFIKDILNMLRDELSPENFTSITVFTEKENVFSNFTLPEEFNDILKDPFWSFRIAFDTDAEVECGNGFNLNI